MWHHAEEMSGLTRLTFRRRLPADERPRHGSRSRSARLQISQFRFSLHAIAPVEARGLNKVGWSHLREPRGLPLPLFDSLSAFLSSPRSACNACVICPIYTHESAKPTSQQEREMTHLSLICLILLPLHPRPLPRNKPRILPQFPHRTLLLLLY